MTIDIPNYLNRLIELSLSTDVSDIHFEPFNDKALIRIRKDGFLSLYEEVTLDYHFSILNRIKVLANLNPSEKRIPQDSSLGFESKDYQSLVDLRISTLPTVHGEKMVVRILKKKPRFKEINDLGMNLLLKEKLKRSLNSNNGLIIISGPTSSGKTTTLYAILQFLNQTTQNITTVEDPVEYKMEGINQVQVLPHVGLDFSIALRAILRQDPNIIMIGEMRDKETAHIAIQAALTGHLVLTSLHTFDAASTITRLLDMGIEPYLIASSVQLVVAQRLVRKKCLCNGENKLCHLCNGTGYNGRFAVFEMLGLDDELHELILRRPTTREIRNEMKGYYYTSLKDELLLKIKEGDTTMDEYYRVMITDDESKRIYQEKMEG